MTIYIGLTTTSEDTTVSVDGWLEGDEADELFRVVQSSSAPIVLNLTDLRSADERGVKTISRLEEQGIVLTGMSDYLKLLMERTAGRVTQQGGD